MKSILVRITSSISLLIGFIFQVFVFYQIYPGFSSTLMLSGPALLAIYTAATLLLGYGLCLFYDPHRPLLLGIYIIPVLFIPFYGIAGSLAMAVYHLFKQKKSYPLFLDEQQMLTPLKDYWSGGDSWEIIKGKRWVQSYFDIMSGGNKNLKKFLLKKIMDENTLYGVKLINIALMDPDYEIRSFAAVVLNKLENDINLKIMAAKRQINRDPGDIQAQLTLVSMYYSYCANGLAEAAALDYYVSIAFSLLNELEQHSELSSQEKLKIWLWKAKIADFNGDLEQASRINEMILEDYPGHSDTLANSCALAFARRDFKKLSTRCRQWMAADPQANPLGESIKTWMGEEKA